MSEDAAQLSKPLISILMPVKNEENYLAACIDSILRQSYAHWELMAVDDGSTDRSLEILETYREQDSRIKIITQDALGVIEALRKAWQNCNGDYITRMDADDLMTPDKLDRMQAQLSEYGRGYIATGFVSYFATGKALGAGYVAYADWLNTHASAGTNYQDIYRECVIPSPCWMMYREDLKRIGAFDSNRYPEDYDLCFRCYQGGLQVIPATRVLHYWRDHAARSSRTLSYYSDNKFLSLKLHYFATLHFDSSRPTVVWGAGRKGKQLVRQWQERIGHPLLWVCNNPKKIGLQIYDIVLQGPDIIPDIDNPQLIIMVSNPESQATIQNQLKRWSKLAMIDYFMFC